MGKCDKVLALNAGSSSIKFCIYEKKRCLLRAEIENIHSAQSNIWSEGLIHLSYRKKIDSHVKAVKEIKDICKKADVKEFQAIVHRFVFGGDKYLKATKLTKSVLTDLKRFIPIAPLHIPNDISVVKAAETFFPKATNIACFDTSFHQTIIPESKNFSLSKSLTKNTLHRFGFHGLSYEYIVSNLPKDKTKVIIAHLGSGTSLCAVKNRKSFDTTMGLTPLGGIMMGTRSGDLDPGLILHLLKEEKISVEKLHYLLNHESGLKGVSNKTSDMKKLIQFSKSSASAKLALNMYCYQVAKQIGAYFVSLNGIDSLVFTGGIGFRSYVVRQKICAYLKSLGIELDAQKNKKNEKYISTKKSHALVQVIETNEEEMMVKQALKLLRM